MQEEARTATVQAAKHSETIDTVQELATSSDSSRTTRSFITVFASLERCQVDTKFDLQIDELQNLLIKRRRSVGGAGVRTAGT